jgi:proline utilization trans-activator
MRLSINLGLHQKYKGLITDKLTRAHRKRVWWTVYAIDRMIASKSGYPASIQSDEIELEFPSDDGLSWPEKSDFISAEYTTATIRLARLTGRTIYYLYSRVHFTMPFSQRVQSVFRDLTEFVETLPTSLQLPSEGSMQAGHHVLCLHLSFNQV